MRPIYHHGCCCRNPFAWDKKSTHTHTHVYIQKIIEKNVAHKKRTFSEEEVEEAGKKTSNDRPKMRGAKIGQFDVISKGVRALTLASRFDIKLRSSKLDRNKIFNSPDKLPTELNKRFILFNGNGRAGDSEAANAGYPNEEHGRK